MKITTGQMVRHESMATELVFLSLVHMEELKKKAIANGSVDVKILIDDQEVDVERFMKRWADNVKYYVERRAQELVNERFESIKDTLYDLEKTMKEAIKEATET